MLRPLLVHALCAALAGGRRLGQEGPTLSEYVDSIGDARMVIDMLVGALQRLLVYPEQGYLISQPVPADVIEAYERLCQAGFTSRLLTTDAASS